MVQEPSEREATFGCTTSSFRRYCRSTAEWRSQRLSVSKSSQLCSTIGDSFILTRRRSLAGCFGWLHLARDSGDALQPRPRASVASQKSVELVQQLPSSGRNLIDLAEASSPLESGDGWERRGALGGSSLAVSEQGNGTLAAVQQVDRTQRISSKAEESPADRFLRLLSLNSAPQHPVSHLLQSIPPRAPSRSSRSNILSYTLHLATATRLASYTAPNGSRDLLQRAESVSDSAKVDIDDEWLESEHKAQGMWKVGMSLLKSNRLEGHLPSSVERRVALARLTEELLSNPSPEQALNRIDERDVQSSAEVDALVALKPLTSPDTTTLYHSMATHAATSSRSATSVAQSLIDLKFGNAVDGEASAPLPDSDVKPFGDSSRESETVFAQGPSAFASTSELTATPHMDYRIVRGQAMRTRAKDIYATSILPSTHTTWCRRHRVPSCSVCTLVSATRVDKRRTNIPGQGLGRIADGKKRLVDLVPQFLGLSSSLLRDLRERANGTDSDDQVDSFLKPDASSTVEINVTAAWYSILHSLLIQACLEGYLVDGWTGTTAIEVLFGVGCGVWEGKGWASRVAQSNAAESNFAKSNSGMEVDEDEGSDSESEEDSEEEEEEREREKEKAKLVEAAQALFGSRDVAQADFERSMRDRIHEVGVPCLLNSLWRSEC